MESTVLEGLSCSVAGSGGGFRASWRTPAGDSGRGASIQLGVLFAGATQLARGSGSVEEQEECTLTAWNCCCLISCIQGALSRRHMDAQQNSIFVRKCINQLYVAVVLVCVSVGVTFRLLVRSLHVDVLVGFERFM